MSKELPYFKFYTSEWLNGDITLEDLELQGLFINVCAYYWHKDCELSYTQLSKKFKSDLLDKLVGEFMQIDENGMVNIDFLNEQFSDFTVRKKKLSDAGKKGAKNKADKLILTTLKPPLSHPSTLREEKRREEEIREDKIIVDNINFSFKSALLDLGINTVLISEWLKVRKSKKLTNSKTAFEAIYKEFKKAQLEPKEIISVCVENSWGGFKAEWLKNINNGTKINTGSNRAVTTTSERQSFE